MIRTLSDEAVVERLRKDYPKRTRTATIIILFGVALMLAGLWFANHFTQQARERLERLAEGTDFEPVMMELSFTVGMKVGSALASTLLGAISVIAIGINLLAGRRKERLLLEYHRALADRTIGRVAQQSVPADVPASRGRG